jgi:acetylornithine deacetylase/succinyl-diaminopimelate desuccinylase-like protein
MPHSENAALLAAQVVERLGELGPVRITEPMALLLERVAAVAPERLATELRRLRDGWEDPALEDACEPALLLALRALVRDTVAPTVLHTGVKYNVIPGTAEIIVDCRLLPGTTVEQMTQGIRRRLGDELWGRCEVTAMGSGVPVEQPLDHPLLAILESVLRTHDPDAIPVPAVAPFATDAKHLLRLEIPTYGFAPLALRPGDRFLELFHGDDERIPVEGLRFGLAALYDAVGRYCAPISS